MQHECCECTERLRGDNIEQDKEIQEYESEVIAYEKTIATLREVLEAIRWELSLVPASCSDFTPKIDNIAYKALAATEGK